MIKSGHMQVFARFQNQKTQSFRKIFFAGITTVVLLLGFFNSNLAQALSGAKWTSSEKNAIIYEGQTFSKVQDTSKYPENIRSKTIFSSTSSSGIGDATVKSIILDNTNDTSSGKFYTFNSNALGNLKQEGNTEEISVDGVSEEQKTNCKVEGGGGWMVCMVANTLAKAMDGIYDLLQGFLKVQPLYVTEKSALFQVWDYTRNLANIIFVFAFLVVIYSQITGAGISNYGIKKILPKLIVAAILINISYYICAIMVDLSNILGAQTQNILIGIRNDIFNGSEIVTATKNLDWANMTAAVLSGAGAVTYGAYAFTMAGGWAALPFMIMGALLVVLYSAFVSLVILAARQAIIIVLVFLAPLAFAANILPNTEKWFEKWKDLLTTMLVMYPLISLLFGGSQLVGTTIIASSNGSFLVFLLGAVVQVAPLAITPTIMKLSGSLLGKFAGMVNNPNKGPVDRAKKFIREGQEAAKLNKISKKPDSLTAKFNQLSYNRSRRLGSAKSVAEQYQKARFADKEDMDLRKAESIPEGGNAVSQRINDFRRNRLYGGNTAYQEMLAGEAANRAATNSSAHLSQIKAELLSANLKKDADGNVVGLDESSLKKLGKTMGSSAVQLVRNMNDTSAYKQAERNNNLSVNNSLANNLRYDNELLNKASGIRGESGKISALASAMVAASKENKEEVEALSSLTKSLNFNNVEYGQIFGADDADSGAKGLKLGEKITKDGIEFEVTKNLRAATAEKFMGTTDMTKAIAALEKTDSAGELHANRADLVEAFKKSGKKDDLQFIGGAMLEKTSVDGASVGDILKNVSAQYVKNVSDERIIKASDEALQIVWSPANISSMNISTVEATLKSIKSIDNEPDKFGKITATQGTEIYNALKEFEKSHKTTYDSILGSSWSPTNIKKK